MSTREQIVEELMQEFGKDSPAFRARINIHVGSATVDLLTEAEGRFSGLEKIQHISVDTTNTQYKLNKDFNAPKKKHIMYDSDGDYSDDFSLVSYDEFYERVKSPADYPGHEFGRIENLSSADGRDGPGDYLIIYSAPGTAFTLDFGYYRIPTEDDTHLIRKPNIVKEYVRAKEGPVESRETSMKIYLAMRSGFKPSLSLRASELIMRPSAKRQRHNKMQHKIGRGK